MDEKPKAILDAVGRYWLLMWTATSEPMMREEVAPPAVAQAQGAETAVADAQGEKKEE